MEKHQELPFVLKREIVQRLAQFDTPTQVKKAIKADHDLDLSVQRIAFYDPTTKNGAALSDDLKDLFFKTRKAFLEEIDSIPIAHKSVRLRRLDRMAQMAEDRGNIVQAAQLLEQAAKEAGDAFSNRHKHELTGKDGKDLPATPAAAVTIIQLPDNGRG